MFLEILKKGLAVGFFRTLSVGLRLRSVRGSYTERSRSGSVKQKKHLMPIHEVFSLSNTIMQPKLTNYFY